MSEPTPPNDDRLVEAGIPRAELISAFSPDTPDEVRARVVDAILAVLNGDDSD